MNRSGLPSTAFINPQGANRGEIDKLLRRAMEIVVDSCATASRRSPLPEAKRIPDFACAASSAEFSEDHFLPAASRSDGEILEDLRAIMAASMNAAHPGYMGHMDSIPSTFSIIGDLAAGALNNNMLSVEMAPVFARLESRLLRRIARRIGLGEQAGGVMTGGGSLANLEALAVARNRKFLCRETGIVKLDHPPVLFASELAHTSIHKAAMLLGLGTQAVISIPAEGNAGMDIRALEEAIARARREGLAPFCVVATAGTTITGALDSIREIEPIARANGLWLHVDAVYGGALVFSPAYRSRIAGVEKADSVTFNPQKWLYVTKTCAMALFRDFGALEKFFRIHAPYMQTPDDLLNPGEISIHGTRHPDILKFWLTIQHFGLDGFARLIEESIRLAEFFAGEAARRPYLEIAARPQLNIVTFRIRPRRGPGAAPGGETHPPAECPNDSPAAREADALNARLQDFLLKEGNFFVSRPLLKGEQWLKAVLLNPFMDESTILKLFAAMDAFHSQHP